MLYLYMSLYNVYIYVYIIHVHINSLFYYFFLKALLTATATTVLLVDKNPRQVRPPPGGNSPTSGPKESSRLHCLPPDIEVVAARGTFPWKDFVKMVRVSQPTGIHGM